MRIIFIRHAEPLQNFNHIISGPRGCRGLTERGFAQAQALEQRLLATGEAGACSAFLTSPILRARQTAEGIARAFPGLALEEEPGLCEMLPGEADGLTHAEATARFGSFDRVAFPDRPIAPGGESWNSFNARVGGALERLAERFAGRTVVAVTHAGFIVVSTLLLFGIPRPGTGATLDPELTGLTEWRLSGGRWQLKRYNDCYHLIS